jgi:hypothetical protein
MTNHGITRRRLLASAGAAIVTAQLPRALAEAGEDSGVRLQPFPTRIHKTRDAGNERTESWVLWLMVETSSPRALQIRAASIQVLSGHDVVRTTRYDDDGAKALTIVPPLAPRLPDGRAAPTPIYWPQAFRVRCTEPVATRIDAMRVELTMNESGNSVVARAMLPVETYEQKTLLVYPFKGRGIITNAGVTNGGHRNRSGQFALDGVGLDAHYAAYVSGDGRKSKDYAGWGRPLIAPAAGTIVRARGDRPDQPDPEKSDPQYYAPEFPDGGDPGNHVVIDHGNGEFSMVAHLQAGSLRVKLGDRVGQGQALGKLGSSGDTMTPHVHYQLQSGPDIQWSDGLPCSFSNIEHTILVRGTYFNAK